MNSLSFLNHHHTATSDLAATQSVTSCRSRRWLIPEEMKNNNQPAASGPRSGDDGHAGSSVQFSYAVDDIESPKSRLEAAINKEWSISDHEAKQHHSRYSQHPRLPDINPNRLYGAKAVSKAGSTSGGCLSMLMKPILIFGIFIMVVSLLGVMGACCRNSSILWAYLVVLLVLLISYALFFVISIMIVWNGNADKTNSSGDYQLSGFSSMNAKQDLRRYNLVMRIVIDMQLGMLYAIDGVGFPYESPTIWKKNNTTSAASLKPDCKGMGETTSCACALRNNKNNQTTEKQALSLLPQPPPQPHRILATNRSVHPCRSRRWLSPEETKIAATAASGSRSGADVQAGSSCGSRLRWTTSSRRRAVLSGDHGG
ncbi:hypothetical protein M0R45_019279 [Rubus argutus]|uniref:Uncharacterized protein n=1 Tax=Rubus argutus TaxID=59490 RepID=A0AAW1X6R1_RUBAR